MKSTPCYGLVLLLVCCHLFLSAQGWERRLPTGIQSAATDVSLSQEGDLIVIGKIVGSSQGRVIKLDADGELQWFVPLSAIGLQRILPMAPGRYAAFGAKPVSGSARLNYVEFDEQGQRQFEQTTILDSLSTLQIVQVIPSGNEHYLIFGYLSYVDGDGSYDFFTAQLDRQGQLNWIRTIDISTKDWCFDAVAVSDGNYVLSGLVNTNGFDRTFLIKVNPEGRELWRAFDVGIGYSINNVVEYTPGRLIAVSFLQPTNATPRVMLTHLNLSNGAVIQQYTKSDLEIIPQSILTDRDGNLVIAGNQQINNSPVTYRVTLAKLSPQAQLLWQRTYGQVNESQRVSQLVGLPRGGYLMVGEILDGGLNNQSYIIRTDKLGNSYTNVIRGQIFQGTCAQSVPERPLQDWFVEITSERDTFYGLTDQQGNYEVRVDTGRYTVEALRPNVYWESCLLPQQIQFSGPFDTLSQDFPFAVTYSCPLLRVDVSTPLLRRCYENRYYVNYCNEGTEPAENTLLEVELDPAFIVESSEPAWTSREGQLLRFQPGRLEVGQCGQIIISGRLDCDNTVLGQTHCVTAQIFPDSLCTPPGVNWDGSSIEVNGRCQGDSIEFSIQNVGDGNMLHELRYIVIEDLIIHRSGYFQLGIGETLKIDIPATGATYRLEAEQAEGHPGSSRPSVAVEGCRLSGQPFQVGIVTQSPFDEGDPFIAVDCQQNIGSWDPNDIQVFPKGQGTEHLIDADTDLEYHIRFQNTGTDTALRILIRDTLPLNLLDPGGIAIGPASHPMEWWVNEAGVLHFLFDPIALVDSTANEPESHGFVHFKIRQRVGNAPGTVINNRAAIFFDYNEPVLTNTAWVKVKKPVAYQIVEQSFCTIDVTELQELTVVDTVPYSSVDSLYIYNVDLLPEQLITIDTSIQAGHTFLGIEWLEDGEVRDSLLNTWGCDSLVITNVTVDIPNGAQDTGPVAGLQLQLYPNPVVANLNVSYLLRESEEVQLEILDASGRMRGVMSDIKLHTPGLHRVHWPVQRFPPGWYLLRLRAGPHVKVEKFLIIR
ncbi:MAG: T9SS type A sorting domain-containing protein [Saprospiraceae bacterium]